MNTLAPGGTIGIIGGGQLGRMLALAAAQLGYRCHILDPDPDCCAGQVSATLTVADYDDRAALTTFARTVDVVTYEFESIDADALSRIESDVPLFPPVAALRIAQDRIAEKTFAAAHGARTAAWAPVSTRAELDQAVARIGLPAILKTTRFGYDGKGQARLATVDDADTAWSDIAEAPAILEAMVAFDREFSVIVAHGQDAASVVWDVPENRHADGILATSTVPAHADILAQAEEAKAIAVRIADALGYVGVLTLEFFASADGPIFNEMAPRVHNSGHWTIEGAIASQFENHIRAVVGLPLASTSRIARGAVMENLIGDQIDDWPALAAEPGAHLHLYGKGAARAGRKMGHVTRLS
jgi:5-(carboxyamino)imidazole ribonucleotide synthase